MPPTDDVVAMMPGRILSVLVQEGQRIDAGAVVCILEAMKMHNEVRSPRGGMIANVRVVEGTVVNGGDVLMNVS